MITREMVERLRQKAVFCGTGWEFESHQALVAAIGLAERWLRWRECKDVDRGHVVAVLQSWEQDTRLGGVLCGAYDAALALLGDGEVET
ncbi:MAG: hypothetical protein JOZ81_03195 [Chloroflexi bacterium]|nr:hypothetical protein [Chloroflexota bacterium]